MKYDLKTKLVWLLFASIPALFFIVPYIVLLINPYVRQRLLFDADTFWLLTTGQHIFLEGIPATDIYSYTNPNLAWVVYQWLFEVFLYLSYALGGWFTVGNFLILLFSTTSFFLYTLLRRNNVNSIFCLIAVSVFIVATHVSWYARPASLTYLLIVLTLLIFNLTETKNEKYILLMPLIMVFWANAHLGFTSGIILLAIYFGYNLLSYTLFKIEGKNQLVKYSMLALVLSVLATFINPYGLELYYYMTSLASSDTMNSVIKELLSPDFHQSHTKPVLYLMIANITLIPFSRNVKPLYVFLTALSLIMFLLFVRNLPFYSIFGSILLALQLQNLQNDILDIPNVSRIIAYPAQWLKKIEDIEWENVLRTPKPINFPVSPVIILVFLLTAALLQQNNWLQSKYLFTTEFVDKYPVQAYKFVSRYKPPGNFYTRPKWGSYAIYKLYPEYKVFIDTRFDMYGETFFDFNHKILGTAKGWLESLESYDVNWIVIERDAFIARSLEADFSKRWFLVYEDKYTKLFMKDTPENRLWYERSGAQEYARTVKKLFKLS